MIASSTQPLPLLAALRAASLASADEPGRTIGPLHEDDAFDE